MNEVGELNGRTSGGEIFRSVAETCGILQSLSGGRDVRNVRPDRAC
jgi:hypothetical protein